MIFTDSEHATNLSIRLSQINGVMYALEGLMPSVYDPKKQETQHFDSMFYLLWELIENVEKDFNALTATPKTVNIKCELTGSF